MDRHLPLDTLLSVDSSLRPTRAKMLEYPATLPQVRIVHEPIA
jgi:hypothetical protein